MLNFDKFFKNSAGRVVLWQWPNPPLYGWIIFKLISLPLAGGQPKTGFEHLSTASLFIWAYLEVTSGVNYFRRLLGLIVLIAITTGYFR